MTTTEDDTLRQLLQAICASPDDNDVRLIYADRLIELGNEDRAELIKVQVELSTLSDWPDDFFRKKELRIREKIIIDALFWRGRRSIGGKLSVAHTAGYCPPDRFILKLFREEVGIEIANVTFNRGFIDSVTCSAEDWIRIADDLVWSPDQTVECTERVDPKLGLTDRLEYDQSLAHRKGKCQRCGGSNRIQRPVPMTAQPIRRLTLTTLPNIERHSYPLYFDHPPFMVLPAEWTTDGRDFRFDNLEHMKAEVRRKWDRIQIEFDVRG